MPVFQRIYEDTDAHWDAYDMCEKLVDMEERFQLWRFRHMKTVRAHHRLQAAAPAARRGVGFLRKALELTFFPELFDVRTVLTQRST